MKTETHKISGNGRLLVFKTGSNVTSLRFGYSSPSFCSLSFDEKHEQTVSACDSFLTRSDLFLPDGVEDQDCPAATVKDICDPRRVLFIRNINASVRIRQKALFPPYVKKYFIKNYRIGTLSRPALLLLIPAGTRFFGNICVRQEQRALITVSGSALLDENGIDIKPGESRIIITSGDPDECVKNALFALDRKEEKDRTGAISCPESVRGLVNDLIASQSESGGIISFPYIPTCDIDAFPALIEAFDITGLEERAKALVGYYLNAYSDPGTHFCTLSSADGGSVIPDVDQGRAAAKLLLGLTLYYENKDIPQNAVSLMKRAFYTASSSLVSGMAPFSGFEEEIERGILPDGFMFHGSAENTVSIITACEKFVSLAKNRRIRLRDGGKGIVEKLSAARSEFEKNFTKSGTVYMNSPALEAKRKRPRFIYSKCMNCLRDGSNVPLAFLERSRSGAYLCPECLSKGAQVEIGETYRVKSVYITALALKNGFLSSENESKAVQTLRDYAQRYVDSSRSLPLRRFLQDLTVLEVLESRGYDMSAYRDIMFDMLPPDNICTSLISGDFFISSRGDSEVKARLISYLIGKENDVQS